jgi:hypothetical protein
VTHPRTHSKVPIGLELEPRVLDTYPVLSVFSSLKKTLKKKKSLQNDRTTIQTS